MDAMDTVIVDNAMRDFLPALPTREMTTAYKKNKHSWGVQCLLSKCGDLSSNSSSYGYYEEQDIMCL